MQLTDLTPREIGVMVPLVIFMFWMGLNATPFLNLINPSSDAIVEDVQAKSKRMSMKLEEENTVKYGEAVTTEE